MGDKYEYLFFKQIYLEHGINYFNKQIFPNFLHIKSCSIIDKYGDSINCQNDFDTIITIIKYEFKLTYNLRKHTIFEKIKSNNIAKIEIQFDVHDCWMHSLSLLENTMRKYFWIITDGSEIDVKFQTVLLQKSLSFLERKMRSDKQEFNL